MKILQTFRSRLLILLTASLIAALGVQYYLNLVAQEESIDLRDEQANALVAGITIGFTSIPINKRVSELVNEDSQTYFDEPTRERILDIIVINSDWQVVDSLNPDYLPQTDDLGNVVYKQLDDLQGLPPLAKGRRLGPDLAHFPNRKSDANRYDPNDAHAIPIETSQGRWYVMVLLKNDKTDAQWRAALPLVYTLGVLLVSGLITLLAVWRFTRPISDLSDAAIRVAEGDLSVRVPQTGNDELGRLSANFNEMAAGLEKNRELETQLQQAEKSAVVGRLGSAIAHEIRNPLNYINLTLDHLRKKYAPEDDEKRATFEKLTSQLKNEVARINQQITDFLNYSRPATANLQPIDARTAIEESLRLAEPQALESNVKIGVIEHENVPQILGDPTFLRSVFNNLFLNAIQAIGNEGGHISVKITADDDSGFVTYVVADDGPGIPKENLAKIFEPYFSTKETGTGLGLAIVQKIIDIHNGTIDVESTEGKGTQFTVKLPSAKDVRS